MSVRRASLEPSHTLEGVKLLRGQYLILGRLTSELTVSFAMSDVQFIRCGACKYRWNWKCRTTCFKCNAKLDVPEAVPRAPGGAWAKPKGGTSGAWTEATTQRNRKRYNKADRDEKAETSKGPADAARLLESLRAMLPSLADCAEINALADKVEEEKRAAQTAKPLSVKARHLEARVAHKRRTQASAQERVAKAQLSVEEAQAGLETANKELAARSEELRALEEELAMLQKETMQAAEEVGLPDVEAAAAEVQRLEQVVQSLPSATGDNFEGVVASLQSIAAALGKAIPQAAIQPITDVAAEEEEQDLDDEVDEFMDTFEGLDHDDNAGAIGGAADQRRAHLKQFLAKSRHVKIKGKRPHG